MNQNAIDILLVEGNLSDAALAMREFKKNHLANKIVHVKSGKEALELVFPNGRSGRGHAALCMPKVVLLDIQMPKLNGIRVLRRIRSDTRTKSIPVVILTFSNQDPEICKWYDLGANSYIVKPVSFHGFLEAIRGLGLHWLLLNHPPT